MDMQPWSFTGQLRLVAKENNTAVEGSGENGSPALGRRVWLLVDLRG
ncbi:hypothetical protein FHS92_001464 [Sphingobium subterraneum]|uniref:Uncharacterized protein n=1 Tax=Sphingobium subterraneum TaxID=627688 RepID=A0A841J596_9SPHN|nr:hypothetical protein [Sphingobium subterraneum]